MRGAVIAAVLLVTTLTGCGQQDQPAYGSTLNLSPAQVYESGQVCLHLDKGADLPDTWRWMTDEQGFSSDLSVALIESGIRHHCPEYEGLLS